MNIPKKISFSELAAFVKKQKDDKPLDMEANYFHQKCGCLLVQFGRKTLPKETLERAKKEKRGCGYASINYLFDASIGFDWKTEDFIKELCNKKVKTYKTAKRILKSYEC